MLSDGFYFVNSDNSYSKFAAKLKKLVKSPQSPTMKPDELSFEAALTTIMQPYAEIVYVVRGCQKFHGIVTDRGSGLQSWDCKAKSMQWLLDWRYIPDVVYHNLALNYILASGLPSSTYAGALFLAQSIIPNGKWVAYNTKIIKLVGAGSKSAIGSASLYGLTNYPGAGAIDTCDGVKTLTAAASAATVTNNQYFRDVNDLYVQLGDGSYRPNAYHVAAAYWCDAKIRLGTIDIGTKKCTTDISLVGKASDSLNTFAEKLGREAEFRPANDGYVYYSLSTTVGRGSETAPIMRFVHGRNAIVKITKKIEPDIQVAIGINDDDPPVSVSDWSNVEPQIFKIYDGKGELREELVDKLQSLIDENADSFQAIIGYEEHFLRIGDWVELSREGIDYSLRIKRIEISPGKTILDCGKTLFDAKEKFGELLRPEVDASAEPIQTKTINSGSGSFVVKYANVVAGGWKCYYEESFSSDSDDSSLSTNPFIVIKIAGKIVPPGRIRIGSGSVKIDITDYCTKSTTKNITNAVVRTMYNYTGWTSSKCEIKQYRGTRYV